MDDATLKKEAGDSCHMNFEDGQYIKVQYGSVIIVPAVPVIPIE